MLAIGTLIIDPAGFKSEGETRLPTVIPYAPAQGSGAGGKNRK